MFRAAIFRPLGVVGAALCTGESFFRQYLCRRIDFTVCLRGVCVVRVLGCCRTVHGDGVLAEQQPREHGAVVRDAWYPPGTPEHRVISQWQSFNIAHQHYREKSIPSLQLSVRQNGRRVYV